PNPSESWHYHLRRGVSDVLYIILIILAFLLLLDLFGYHNTDPGWSTSGGAQDTQHFFGILGAYVADALFSALGYGAYLLPVGLGAIGWQGMRHTEFDTEMVIWKSLALLITLISLCGVLSLHFTTPINSLSVTGGGIVGQKITIELLRIWPVQVAMSIYTLLLSIGITLLLEANWFRVLEWIGQHGVNAYYWLWRKVDGQAHQPPASDGPRRSRLRDPESGDGDDAPAGSGLGAVLRERALAALDKYRAYRAEKGRNKPRPQRTPTYNRAPVLPPDREDGEHLAFRAPPRHQPGEEAPPVRSEPNLSWAHYKSQIAPEPEEVPPPPADGDDYRPKSDYFARRQEAGLPLQGEDSTWLTAANDAANDEDLGTVDEDDFAALDDNYDTPATAEPAAPAEESGDRNEPQLRVRLNSGAGAAVAVAGNRAPFIAPSRIEKPYQLPALDLLNPGKTAVANYSDEELDEMAMQVEQALKNYKLSVRVENIIVGPVVTCIELSLAPGIKVSSITNLERDIARLLSVQSVRVVEVIPGRPFIGLEIPNRKREMVPLRGVLESPQYQKESSPLTVVLGADISGKPVIANLGKMPHLLVAGTTGSGKSVGINVILASMLYKAKPDELKLILVDPKTVELAMYRDIPHLLAPVVTDMSDAENALRWAVAEMERRYQLMVALKVRKLDEFNKIIREAEARGEHIPDPLVDPTLYVGLANPVPDLKPLPHIVIVIDELADMMMVAGKNVEQLIARIAQKARAAGIHMILATQRPSVDVITGLIKSNIPTRIAFQVSSKIDSRTILNSQGAESLLGNGDMLYLEPGSSMRRVHGAFIDDKEVDRLTTYLKTQGEPHYEDITDPAAATPGGNGSSGGGDEDGELDPLYDQAVQVVIESGKASISGLQRHLSIGYNRAARMVDVMERAGLVSRPDNKGIRKVLTPGGGGEEY
ncbi:MAG: DNA translocase FtsK, partial [Cardiobacterium sp.]